MESREQLVKQLVTIRDYARWAVSSFNQSSIFYGHGTDNAWDEALQLIFHGLQLPLNLVNEFMDAKLTNKERNLLAVLIETRIKDRLPLPYLTGEAWFAGFQFKVDERVLIPRSPIAELLEVGYQPWAGDNCMENVMDLCTGGGCIGIATALYMPDVSVDLVDISTDALQVAEFNIARYELEDRVQAVSSDLFSAFESSEKKYDLIVSNPPYVDKGDLESMPAEFGHEPVLALAAGDDGLDLARRILYKAADFLTDEGLLILEVGNSGMTLEEQFPQVPFTWIEFERGGDGVMVFHRDELLRYRELFV